MPDLKGQGLTLHYLLTVPAAEILGLIHTASLIHDGVVDASSTRRGVSSAPAAFGNKASILGGNYMLGRAWATLPKVEDSEASSIILGVLDNLVEGELMQLRETTPGDNTQSDKLKVMGYKEAWNAYLQKTYVKTASLVAKGARATLATSAIVGRIALDFILIPDPFASFGLVGKGPTFCLLYSACMAWGCVLCLQAFDLFFFLECCCIFSRNEQVLQKTC